MTCSFPPPLKKTTEKDNGNCDTLQLFCQCDKILIKLSFCSVVYFICINNYLFKIRNLGFMLISNVIFIQINKK